MFISKRKALKALLAAPMMASFSHVSAQPPLGNKPIKLAMIEALSGAFANTGESVYRNLLWAVERVNARGGVKAASGQMHVLELNRYDNKGQVDEALSAMRAAVDDGAQVLLHGNSSAVAAALIDAVNKHNEREPTKRVVYLNYSAVDPILTNEKCSPWHFRFDAHADMRMNALFEVIKTDSATKSVYLIGQDYSFGQSVLTQARKQFALKRADVRIVGDELHPVGRVKDFLPYATKIKASGADAVVTGNWGNDLTLLVKAAREVGFNGKFYTFYGNALGAPTAIGDAGIGKVYAVADWLPNLPTPESEAFYRSFRVRFPRPQDDYVHLRMQLMIETLANALNGVAVAANGVDVVVLRDNLSKGGATFAGQTARMRGADGQIQQPLVVGVMDKVGTPGVNFDVEGSGYGFRVVQRVSAAQAEMPHNCTFK